MKPAVVFQAQEQEAPLSMKVRLRPLSDANFADFTDLLRYRHWREDNPASSDIPLTLAQDMAKMAEDKQSGCLIWLIERADSGQAVGVVTLMPVFHIGCRHLGYWLAPEHHGKGYASDAIAQLVRFCFECTSIVRLQAQVLPENPASARVLEKAGFVQEALLPASEVRDGAPCDALLYGVVKK